MTTTRKLLAITVLSAGCAGVAVCLVGIVAVWQAGSRLRQATDIVFDELDGTVVIVHKRAVQTQEHIRASKITADEIAATVKDWTKHEAGQQVAQRLDIEEKTTGLASAMRQADHWLEVSESSVTLVQQILSAVNSVGAPVDPAAVDGLMEELSSLRSHLDEVTRVVTSIRDHTREETSERPLKQRLEQVSRLTVRVAATLGTIDSRLDKFTNRLSKTQEDLRELKARTIRQIWLATIAVMLFILWMMAGQAALCLLARNALVRREAISTNHA